MPWALLGSSYLKCAVPRPLRTLQAQRILPKQLILGWIFSVGNIHCSIVKSKAKLHSRSEWPPKFISTAFSSCHQTALSLNPSLLGLQMARKCFTVKRYTLQENLLETFHQTFLNFIDSFSELDNFWRTDVFKELVSLKYCEGIPFLGIITFRHFFKGKKIQYYNIQYIQYLVKNQKARYSKMVLKRPF